VVEDEIMQSHFNSTQQRFKDIKGPILVLQDTTEFSYQRKNVAAIGVTNIVNSGKTLLGRNRLHTVCGILMHTSLAITTLISIFCIISRRILWITMLNRANPKTKSNLVFTEHEVQILSNCSKNKVNTKRLTDCILQLAKLGRYLGYIKSLTISS